MKKELVHKWIEALSSGKYPKGKHYLVQDGKYCCLGVLGRICGLSDNDLKEEGSQFTTKAVGAMLSGVHHQEYGLTRRMTGTLAPLNDNSDSFEPIIEKLKGGFCD